MIGIVATALLIGLAAAVLSGGRVRRLGDVRVSGAPLAFGALALMVAVSLVELGSSADRALIAGAYALAAAFLVLNIVRSAGIMRVGFAVLALGWLLNAAVMIPNGGMPLSRAAYAASGQSAVPTPGRGGFFKIVIADEHTVLRGLGDVITLPPYHRVVSAGDLVLMGGLILLIVGGMRVRVIASAPEATRRLELVRS